MEWRFDFVLGLPLFWREGEFREEASVTSEKFVGFGASFDGSGLVSTGTVRELVKGTEQEHVEEDVFALDA